jgi:predicted nucleic acid-binding protein
MPARRKPFFDTNILVYCFDLDSPAKLEKSRALITEACTERYGAVSYQVIQEFTNVALKAARPMSVANVRRAISELCEPIEIVHFSLGLYEGALTIFEQYRTSWYDALILAAAQQAGCAVIYTEDLHHGLQLGSLRVENPFRG